MARSQTSGSSKTPAKRKASSPAAKHAQAASRAQGSASRSRVQSPSSHEPLLDDRSKRDIVGVACAVLAVALFVVAALPAQGLVTGVLSGGLHLGLGVGCYILPFVLLLISFSLFYRKDGQSISARVAVGLLIMFFAVLVILALYTPGVDPSKLDDLFLAPNLASQGGYAGAGVAWVLLLLFGQVVSTIVMVGLIVISLIVIGFSISALVEKIREKRAEASELRAAAREAELPFVPDAQMALAPRPRVQRRRPSVKRQKGEPVPSARIQLHRDSNAALPDDGYAVRDSFDTARFGGVYEEPGDALTAALPPAGRAEDSAPTRAIVRGDEGAQTAKVRKSRPHVTGKTVRSSRPVAEVSADIIEGAETASITRRLGKASREDVPTSAPTSAAPTKKARTKKTAAKTPSPAAPEERGGFTLPSMDLLRKSDASMRNADSEATLRQTAMMLQDTLADFGVDANVVGWSSGPTVTLYKVSLPSGVRVSRVTNLTDDIALAMASQGVRIFSPIPGTNYVGIEVPNAKRRSVLLSDVLPSAGKGPLEVAIGEDVEGHPIVSDLAKMPHLLIGGTTGSGKSVSINGMIMSILMRATPDEVRFIMIDPKRVEFTPYNGIPHLYVPVVTECKEASSALSWAVAEMERRLKVFSAVGVRNIAQYNAKAQAAVSQEASGEEGQSDSLAELPYIVIIIDELADLMMNVGKEVEFSISRLAQLARAAGIHMIVATQRPSANVVTGLIKANITNRIAFNVASGIDSRVILDTPGAENLIGWGDMLLSTPGMGKPQRLQGCLVTEDEIAAVVEHLKTQGEPEYHSEILQTNVITLGASAPDGSGGTSTADDPLIWEAAEIVVSTGLGSTSNIQRRLKVGYSRAGRIMDMLEEKGIVGPPNGSKPRDVLVDEMELETLKAFEMNDTDRE